MGLQQPINKVKRMLSSGIKLANIKPERSKAMKTKTHVKAGPDILW
jgi:hypothetical protein